MSTTPYLGITELTPNQTGKETTINTALLALEAAMNATLAVNMAAGNVTLSVSQFTGNFIFVTSGLTAARTLNIPAQVNGVNSSRLFTVSNAGTFPVTVQITGGAGGNIPVNAGDALILYADGAGNIKKALSTFAYTDESAQDAIAAAFAAGTHTGITITYDDANNKFSFAATYGDENAQDAIAAAFAAGTQTGLTIVYDDANNKFNFTVPQYTDENAQDAVAAALLDDGGITITYDDAGNHIKIRSSRFLIPFFFESAPLTSEVLGRYIATDAFTIAANFAGSLGAVASPPNADFTITLTRQTNATGAFATIGTIVVHTDGSITFATSGGTSKAIAANDVLKFIAQSTTDAAILGGVFTIRGT